MTVIDRLRTVATAPSGSARTELVAAGWGAATAAASWLLVTVLVAAAVLADGGASVGEVLGGGSAVWLAAGGARLALGASVIALVPLLGLAALVLSARVVARRVLPVLEDLPLGEGPRVYLEHHGVRTVLAWVGGYAAVGLLTAALTLLGPLDVRPLSLLLPLLVVPMLGVGLAGRVTTGWSQRLPAGLRRGLVPGLRGAGLLLGAGAALVLLLLVLGFSRVAHVQGELAPGLAGGVLLTTVQALTLPNLAIWALSWMAGPGYSVSLGAQTTWTEAQSSLMPMVPVLAAGPEPGPLPWLTRLAVLVPVLVGAWIARHTLSRLSRLASTRTKLSASAWAVTLAAALLALLDAVGGGSLGADRLADIGAPAPALFGVLLIELGLGALAVIARDWWRLRR